MGLGNIFTYLHQCLPMQEGNVAVKYGKVVNIASYLQMGIIPNIGF